MAWKDSLLDASFRGVPFDVMSVSDSGGGELAEHTYAYSDGADIESMGNEARVSRVKAIFWGDDYEVRLDAFIQAITQIGKGELVHPVFGTRMVLPGKWSIDHAAEDIDSALVVVNFHESNVTVEVFADQLSQQVADAASAAADVGLGLSGAEFASAVSDLTSQTQSLSVMTRINMLRDRMNAFMAVGKLAAQGVITSGLDYVTTPYAFASDIAAVANNLIDLRQFDPAVMMAQWRDLRDELGNIIRLPDDGVNRNSEQESDDTTLSLLVAAQRASSQVDAASAVLAVNAGTPTLTPDEIEELCGSVRVELQSCIDAHRSFYPLVEARAVIEPMKNAAQLVQQAGEQQLALLPPLIQRVVDGDVSIRLLAFNWYGDAGRGDELLRLNPDLASPNFLHRGDVLNAYAQ